MTFRSLMIVQLLLLSLTVGCIPAPFATCRADLARGRYACPDFSFGDSLVVASYNIRFGEKIAQAIADLRQDPRLCRADLLLLQEMDPQGCDRIARELGYDFVYYPAAIHPHHNHLFGNAILTRGEIQSAGFIELPKHGILTGTNRIAVVADVRFGERTLRAVSIHTSTPIVPQSQRIQQVRALIDSLSSWRGAIVVGGDFNTTTDKSLLRTSHEMLRAGYRRVILPGRTTTRPDRRSGRGSKQILDHLFYRTLAPRCGGISTAAVASDHYPIWAVFGWPAEGM